MVDISGHLAIGLLWALPVWFVWRDRMALAFVGLVALAALLPDVDLWIDRLAPSLIRHHGVTHTVVFVAAASAFAGALAAALLTDRVLRSRRLDAASAFAFTSSGVLVGGLSHLFGDLLSAPDIAQPVEPFWPVVDKPWSVDVVWYSSPWWNLGLLVVGVLLHATVAYVVDQVDHPHEVDET